MNCRTFEHRLQSLLDERLSIQEDALLNAHALNCDRCQQLLDGQQRLWTLLECEPAPAPSVDLARRVIANLKKDVKSQSTVRTTGSWMYLVVAAAVLLILSPMVVYYGRLHGRVTHENFVQQGRSENHSPLIANSKPTPLWNDPQDGLDSLFGMLGRIDGKGLNHSVDEITGTLRPITASFAVPFDALRKTLPLRDKNDARQPQADARNPEVFA